MISEYLIRFWDESLKIGKVLFFSPMFLVELFILCQLQSLFLNKSFITTVFWYVQWIVFGIIIYSLISIYYSNPTDPHVAHGYAVFILFNMWLVATFIKPISDR